MAHWPTSAFPAPWKNGALHIGGVCAVGFSADGKWLLVMSHSGRGVFDCETLQRVARDDSESHGLFDKATEEVPGIGPLDGVRIPVFGMRGAIRTRAQLPTRTEDGWALDWKEAEERLGMPDTPVSLRAPHQVSGPGYPLGEYELLYAIGFSPTGRTLVIAESHTITILCR